MKRLPILIASLVLASPVCRAIDLTCFADEGTNKRYCTETNGIRQNGEVRGSKLYMGGPKNINATPYWLLVNCRRMVSTIQDNDGINFGGGTLDSVPKYTRHLMRDMCEAKKTKTDKSLKQFQ